MSVPDESLSIESVRALVAERSRFDEWLSALESRRESTPSHVFERVHGDYTVRRATVIDQLAAHVPALATLLQSLDARAESLAATMASQEDERAEAMLRHTVGEFDDATWEEVRSRVEATLETLFGEQLALEQQRDDVRLLLTESTPPEGWSSSAMSSADPTTVEDRAVAADATSTDVEPSGTDASEAAGPALAASEVAASEVAAAEVAASEAVGMDSAALEDAGSEATAGPASMPGVSAEDAQEPVIAGEWTWAVQVEEAVSVSSTFAAREGDASGPSVEATPPEATSAPGDQVRVASVTETLASIEADVVDEERAEPSPVESRLDDRPSMWAAAVPSSQVPPAAAPAGEAPPAADAFDELAFLRSVIDPKAGAGSAATGGGAGAPPKTLRCTECGTMNLPTEWYCERCGSELASF